jgi:3-phosphoshikimate 1-carboxyvinyltransferase
MNMHSTEKDVVILRPARRVAGTLRLPGDKSISHRYAMLAALAHGRSLFRNFSSGADCASTLDCVRALGCSVTRDGDSVKIEGRAGALQAPAAPLDCGNSGSTMRMLAGILAGQPFRSELRGDSSLSRRPMQRVIAPLTAMGARITGATDGRPPLQIEGRTLRAVDYELPVPSAQVKTAILLAGLQARGTTRVTEPVATRDHGELALTAFGAEVERDHHRISIAGGQKLHAIEADIPGDISSAAFFLCAAALLPGSQLAISDLLLNPTRAHLLDLLSQMGANIALLNVEERHGELCGTVQIQAGKLRGANISGALSAALIDELPVLAAIAPFTQDGVEISGARELRVKESDRIAAVAENLRRMGAEVEERDDGLRVPGGQQLHGAELHSSGDHRIAMAFAVASLRAEGETRMAGASAARISFPEFFAMLESVVER